MFKPLFRGEFVRLAAPKPEDAEFFAHWADDDDYARLLDDDPVRPLAAANFAHFATAHDDHYFHLRTLEYDKVIGFVVLHTIKWASQTAEMAIGIGEKEYRGKGYGSDALKLILTYGFTELNLYRIGLTVMDYNTRAIKAYERAGFVREGAKRKAVQRASQRYDLLLFSILRDEWATKQGSK